MSFFFIALRVTCSFSFFFFVQLCFSVTRFEDFRPHWRWRFFKGTAKMYPSRGERGNAGNVTATTFCGEFVAGFSVWFLFFFRKLSLLGRSSDWSLKSRTQTRCYTLRPDRIEWPSILKRVVRCAGRFHRSTVEWRQRCAEECVGIKFMNVVLRGLYVYRRFNL